jgi:hypothetical protein
VFLNDVDALDNHPVVASVDALHCPAQPFVIARDNLDFVTYLDTHIYQPISSLPSDRARSRSLPVISLNGIIVNT